MVKGIYILTLAQIGITDMEEQKKVIDFLTQLARIGIKNKELKDLQAWLIIEI